MLAPGVTVCFHVQVEVVEGVAGEEDHHDDQEEAGEENAEAEGHHDEHDEDGEQNAYRTPSRTHFLKALLQIGIISNLSEKNNFSSNHGILKAAVCNFCLYSQHKHFQKNNR